MASADRELEEQLMEAGNRLSEPPASVDELLSLLDQVENFLGRVEQSPPMAMQTALSLSLNALVSDKLLKHSDVDVKVAVASCISEITRITAPDAPYDDDQMKDVFQLIVSSFENLFDKSSRSYSKRASILETVAKVRSCVVMLDLECDGLIVEMFQHFLKAIRDYHPENVFSSMETIMTLVLEESEDISLELLNPILAGVKMDNEEVLPIARKLGERVFENCAVKLKPYLTQAVKSSGVSLDNYSKVVASICERSTEAIEHNDDNAIGELLADKSKLANASSDEAAQADETKLTTASSDEAAQLAKESVIEEACHEEVDPSVDRSPKSVMSNGITEAGNEGSSVELASLKKPEDGYLANQSINVNMISKADTDDSDAGKSVKSESKQEQTAKRKGRKPYSLVKSTDPSDSSHIDSEKDAEKLPDRRRSRSKDAHTSPGEDPSIEAVIPSENEKEIGIQLSTPKALEGESLNVASPSPSGSLPDESCLKKLGRPKKKKRLAQEDVQSLDVVSKKASEGTSDSEVKPQRRSGKKAPAVVTKESKSLAAVAASKNEGVTTSDSEEKPLKHSGKKVDASTNIEDKSSARKREDGKRRGRGKDTREKGLTKSSAKDDVKEVVSSPKRIPISAQDEGLLEETPKINSKRKRTLGKNKESETVELGENLVGSKVKVWWPKDQAFYKGVIDSFDPAKKRHKVLYTDGDEETLNLEKERWELAEGDSVSDGEQATEDPSPNASYETHRKKNSKTNSEPSAKQEKMEKRGGAASSGKLKGTASKSGRKSNDDAKVDSKSKEHASKSGGKSEDDGGKSKEHASKSSDRSKKSGKLVDDVLRAAGKSKDVDGGTPKTITKSKQVTPKTVTKSKGKSPQSGNKSNTNGMGKVKSSSSKVKDTEGVKGKSSDSARTPESVKGKSPDVSKARESEAKSGKKRRRGARG